jgi:Fur family iron response transcriptional regulator
MSARPFANALELLRAASLRPTRQRLALARLLFEQGDRHVSAEQLHSEAVGAAVPVSLATVYNTLHQFVAAGLLRGGYRPAGRHP